MAADQLNKRSKSSNIIRHTSWETQKAKKKKFSHHDLNIKSNISLEWDEKKEQVVPKKEQIGVARRDLTPFLPLLPHSQNALGDVFAAPSELFQLDNLTSLLSYEVWQTHLSVQERGFLTQFLPEGAEPHKIVHELLGGNNFYFGNPFMKWGSSVCSGDCHPDAILSQEQCNKANKIAYYSELHKYHTKMIGNLQLWKERWASCANPENEFTQKILRSRKDFHKSGSLHENGIQYGQEDEFGATSNSCSWDADDKSYTSDSPNLAITNGETIMRIPKMDLENRFYDSSGERRSVARARKGDKIRKLNIECGDGAKYMSYIKVSKEQHERVKSSMKHSNTSIQPRSLNHVLGNLDSFCVQPYEVFEEEERQNLHHHWLNLAKIDLPAGYENWKSWQSAKREVTKSLKKEIEDKRKSNHLSLSNLYPHNEENEETQILLLHGDHNANLDSGLVNSEDDEEEEQQLVGNLCDEQLSDVETDDVLLVAPEDTMERNDESLFQSEADLNDTDETAMQIEQTDESSEDSPRNHHLPPITIHNNNQNFCPITIATNNEPNPFVSNLHEYTETMSQPDAPVSQQFPLPPAPTEIWPSTTLPTSYYHQPPPVVTHGYGELSLGHPQIRRSDGGGGGGGGDSFFYPYANQDTRNELLLHSLFKDPGTSYLHEHKLSRLGYHPTGGDPVATTSQFPRNLQENIFADGGGRFTIPRQEQLLPLHDWPGNTHQPIQNWFSGDEVARDGWSGNQDMGNGCVTGGPVVADESLYSVLSQCNGLRSGVNFGSSGEFIQSGNYGGIGRPMGSNSVAPRAGLNYMSGNEAQSGAGGAGTNGLGWMNLPKPFQRSWNANELG
ncbi:unnamed protein product [Lactuca saligna]|uniref:DEUBAD domain-containing protein n=1 Tax=Lactuca saligna TaxID=75948 RepID=A0AA35YNP4_LACSI|nr:unnamed protein product [Lactuca saligna]